MIHSYAFRHFQGMKCVHLPNWAIDSWDTDAAVAWNNSGGCNHIEYNIDKYIHLIDFVCEIYSLITIKSASDGDC